MLFMVIERFAEGKAAAVYERFRAQDRAMPETLRYVDSWVATDLKHCFVLVECDDATALQEWVAAWHDLVSFEFVPVTRSADTAALFARLAGTENAG